MEFFFFCTCLFDLVNTHGQLTRTCLNLTALKPNVDVSRGASFADASLLGAPVESVSLWMQIYLSFERTSGR